MHKVPCVFDNLIERGFSTLARISLILPEEAVITHDSLCVYFVVVWYVMEGRTFRSNVVIAVAAVALQLQVSVVLVKYNIVSHRAIKLLNSTELRTVLRVL